MIRKDFSFLLALFFLPLTLLAQHPVEGFWEGTITTGGIYSEKGYKLELFLESYDQSALKGRALIHLSNELVVEMKVGGKIHHDRSVSLEDLAFFSATDAGFIPSFTRKYQLIYNRSVWESTLNGYWQEITPHYFNERREKGRIFLKRAKGGKA